MIVRSTPGVRDRAPLDISTSPTSLQRAAPNQYGLTTPCCLDWQHESNGSSTNKGPQASQAYRTLVEELAAGEEAAAVELLGRLSAT
jgi:hypothetical protein